MKRIVLLFSILLVGASTFASFPVQTTPTENTVIETAHEPSSSEVADDAQGGDMTVATILAVVSVVLLPMGLARWYLGSKGAATWQTILTFVGAILTLVLVGFALLAASWIWQVIDLIRILGGESFGA